MNLEGKKQRTTYFCPNYHSNGKSYSPHQIESPPKPKGRRQNICLIHLLLKGSLRVAVEEKRRKFRIAFDSIGMRQPTVIYVYSHGIFWRSWGRGGGRFVHISAWLQRQKTIHTTYAHAFSLSLSLRVYRLHRRIFLFKCCCLFVSKCCCWISTLAHIRTTCINECYMYYIKGIHFVPLKPKAYTSDTFYLSHIIFAQLFVGTQHTHARRTFVYSFCLLTCFFNFRELHIISIRCAL